MSETVDLMLDGVICEGCGIFLGGATGAPRRCFSCEEVSGDGSEQRRDTATPFDMDDGSDQMAADDTLPF